MQAIEEIQPLFVNTNTALLKLKANESPFIKNSRIAFGRNADGMQGGNFGLGKKMQSNWPLVLLDLPTGTCKVVLFYEHTNLNEAYIGIWNSLGKHTLFILYGNTLTSEVVYQGPQLDFTIDPKNFIAEHRAYVRLIYDVYNEEERHVREKVLVYTDGHGDQRWINVLSAIGTKGYNATLFPYYKLFGPHFDANEFIDYSIRPPMFCPKVTALPRTAADVNLQNFTLNKSFSFAYRYVNTDGRGSTLSPHSNPVFVSKSPCATSTSLTRSYDLELYAGSAHVELIQVLVRNCGGDWMLYDTLYKFSSDGSNSTAAIGDKYWLRTNPWSDFSFKQATNTIHYIFSGDRQVTTFSKEDAIDFYNNVPLKSYALTAAGDALIWGHNLRNYNNLPANTLEQFQFDVMPSDNGSGECSIKNSKITLYAYMARHGGINQVVYTQGTAPTAQKFFGGISRILPVGPLNTISWDNSESTYYGLNFGVNNNFICYLAGTPYLTVGIQYLVTPDGLTMTEVDALDSTNPEHKVLVENTIAAGGYFVQKFVMSVPAGNYIARLARHSADITGEYQLTSTYVQGVLDHRNLVTRNADLFADPVTNFGKEFAIDATAGDVDLWGKGDDLFFIMVPKRAISGGFSVLQDLWRFIEGNVYEQSVNPLNPVYPIELLHYKQSTGDVINARGGVSTDHNGFFFQYTAGPYAYQSEVFFDGNFRCAYNTYVFRTQINKNTAKDYGYFPGQNVTFQDNYDLATALSTRIVITGKIVNCDTAQGIPSIGVTLTNGPTFFTDTNGVFTYYARGHYAADRIDRFYINGGGACLFISCNCGPAATLPFTAAGIACNPTMPRTGQSDILVKLKLLVINGKGLKSGGRYGIAGNFMDLPGRTAFSQPMKFVNIPTFMETGVFTPSQIKWTINGNLNLPSWVKYFTLSRTVNLAFEKPVQWVGDKIDFINNKGDIVPDGNGAIRARITIQSLLDFNIKNTFNTNVNYQFVQGDVVRIMDDGDTNLFIPANTMGFMDYQVLGTTYNQSIQGATSNQALVSNAVQKDSAGTVTGNVQTTEVVNPVNATDDGVSFIIEFDERLLALTNKTGFWIELQHPRDIETIEDYCEIVTTIPVINGEPAIKTGILDTFDTYYQQRSILVPNALGKTYAHPFESASVTDYSQANCSSCGRHNVPDPLVKQTWYEDEIIETDEIINEGRVNGLGRCREKNRKNFKGQTFGAIVAIHAERKRLIFVCELDWFVTDYQMNYVRATPSGLLQSNLDETVSDAFPKEGSVYGCALEDTASIVFFDGTSIWADRYHSAIVALDYRHNQSVVPIGYRDAVNIAVEDVQSYFLNKFNHMLKFNASLSADDYLNNLIEIVAGIDPQTGEYNITFRPRNGLKTDPQYFVNDEREICYDLAETFVYNPDFKKWVSWTGYAPEFYGKLTKSISGVEMIAFAAGQPWFHNSIGKTGSMNFFGVQTNQVFDLPMNINEDEVKIFQAIIVASPDQLYFVDRIITENQKYYSYIPKAYFKRQEQVWYANFLCNMGGYPNTLTPVKSLLVDGNRTIGKAALVRLVSDPETSDIYTQLNTVGYRITGSGKTKKSP